MQLHFVDHLTGPRNPVDYAARRYLAQCEILTIPLKSRKQVATRDSGALRPYIRDRIRALCKLDEIVARVAVGGAIYRAYYIEEKVAVNVVCAVTDLYKSGAARRKTVIFWLALRFVVDANATVLGDREVSGRCIDGTVLRETQSREALDCLGFPCAYSKTLLPRSTEFVTKTSPALSTHNPCG